MTINDLSAKITELEKQLRILNTKRVYQDDLVNGAVKQRHIEAMIIFSGLAINRPDGTTEVQAYFATDTNVLSLWNGTSWVSETFT